ncbi:MAG: transporter substrate-binding domain-containing protein [Oscillospiraceae bacterium]|jgi:PAS domain S-box-containing protein|nr:transporter substrate-binding domain-containing protein [Oscillospiraceae bacterium]
MGLKNRQKKIIQRSVAVLLLCAVVLGITGCTTKAENPPPETEIIKTYHEIPDITESEIAAIEALKASRQSFIFGKIISTEGFILPSGVYAGFSPKLCRLLSDLFEIPFKLEFHEWDTLKDGLDNGSIDFTSEFGITSQRQTRYIMTDPIAQRTVSILTYGDKRIETPYDLNGLKIGIFVEDTAIRDIVIRAYPGIEFEVVPILSQADDADMLRRGEVDAVIGKSAGLTYKYDKTEDLTLTHGMLPLAYTHVALTAANNELEPIISVMNKYIEAKGINILYEIYREGNEEYIRNVIYNAFSDEEKAYINNLTKSVPIVLGTDTYPVSFYNTNEGEFQGIAIDILTEISRLTGIKFEPINEADATWGDILEMLRSGEAALISDLIITEERREYFIWHETPFFSTPYAFFSKIDFQNVELFQIRQATVGVVGWCATRELFEQWFPNNPNVKHFDSQDDALDALENDEIDLFFNLGYILYYQQNYRERPGYKANFTFPVFNDTFFGLNKNEVILSSIIDKAIVHIDTDSISNEWTSRSFDYSRILAEEQSRYANQRTLIVSISATILILLMIFVVLLLLRNNKSRKIVMEAEKEENERFRIMIDTNPLCCKIWNSDYKIIDCNKAAMDLCGFKTKEEYLTSFYSLDPEFQPDGTRSTTKRNEYLKRAFKSNENFSFEWLHVLPDGSFMPAEITLARVNYGDGYVVAGYTRDLREQRRMIKELVSAHEINDMQLTKLNLTIAATQIALWDMYVLKYDPVNPKNRIIYSDEFRNMLGYSDENDFPNILGSWSDKLHPEDKERSVNAFAAHMLDKTGNTPFDVEYRLKKKTGEYAYFHAYGETVRDNEGNPIFVAGALVDVTEEKNIIINTERLRREAEEANKAKSVFLAKMSHEIRTPLNAVIGLSDLVLQSKEWNDENHYRLESINNAGATLLSTVNDILDISKIESGKFELVPTVYEIHSTINDAVAQSILQRGEKPIEFMTNISEDLPAQLYGDELRIKQILNNFLSNAFKYTVEGTVELIVNCTRDGETIWLTFIIRDTGIGIKQEEINSLFSDYVQVDVSANRKIEGTGLGLSIAKKLIELMNGNVTVESEYGKGSVFAVKLLQKFISDDVPGQKAINKTDSSKYSESKQLGELKQITLPYARVLIVDDVITNLDVTEGLMKPYGMTVDRVTSGQEAIDAMLDDTIQYNAVFMDYMMPEMDGIEATQRIREIGTDYTKNIPIIALTANAIVGSKEMFLESGFQSFISKPIEIAHLDAVIREWVWDEEKDKLTGDETEAPAQADEKNWQALHKGVPGINIEKGISRFDGDKDAYLYILRSYAKNTLPLLESTKKVDLGRLKNYATVMHGIKGSSGSICAEDIADLAKALENAAYAGDFEYVSAHNKNFAVTARKLIEDISKMLSEYDADNLKPKKDKPDADTLKRLRQACINYEMSGVYAALEELEAFEYDLDGELIFWLRENVEQINFDEIVEKLS